MPSNRNLKVDLFSTYKGPSALLHGATTKGLLFDPNSYYAGCAICGDVFQTPAMRACGKVHPSDPRYATITDTLDKWKYRHATTHSTREHKQLRLSGRAMTPEAAYKLAAFGVLPLVDMVMDDEVTAALKEAL